jgi:uncharacterized protein (UPF0332 family)
MIGFDWQTYVALAKDLITCKKESCNEEAYLRASVSRAYYGIHSISYRFLTLKCGIPIEGTKKHPLTFEILQASDKQAEKEIGEYLKSLYEKRHHADYDDAPPITDWDARCCLIAAEAALDNLRSIGAI